MTKKNKYMIAEDANGNPVYDFQKVLRDFQKMFTKENAKFPFTESLYGTMTQKFTSAHYDRVQWFTDYNGNWKTLGDDIFRYAYLESGNPTKDALPKLITFLRINDKVEVKFPLVRVERDNGRIVRYFPKMK